MRSLCWLFLLPALIGCGGPAARAQWEWQLPKGFPVPAVPAENPMSQEKVELGRRLFYDVRLSRNGTQACATCHEQARAFTDGRAHAVGSTGQMHRRNAQGLANVAFVSTLTWANPLVTTLERQALLPLFGETPVELGWAGHEDELLSRLSAEADYVKRFKAAYPEQGIALETLTGALASFERTLISGGSAYDRFVAGDTQALGADGLAGLALFNTERLECYHCHVGFTFSDAVAHAGTTVVEKPFHNTGLYDVDGRGAYPAEDTGLLELTQRPGDMGRFRAPSLRNLRFTAPYMHDGSLATLDDVIDAYAAGGEARRQHGQPSVLQSELVRGFVLSADERRQLKAFLETLNDDAFVNDPRFGDPFKQ